MSMLTRCPHCSTSFKITSHLLKMHQGLVRCGHCAEVFNAFDSLYTVHDTPSSAEETRNEVAGKVAVEILQAEPPREIAQETPQPIVAPPDEISPPADGVFMETSQVEPVIGIAAEPDQEPSRNFPDDSSAQGPALNIPEALDREPLHGIPEETDRMEACEGIPEEIVPEQRDSFPEEFWQAIPAEAESEAHDPQPAQALPVEHARDDPDGVTQQIGPETADEVVHVAAQAPDIEAEEEFFVGRKPSKFGWAWAMGSLLLVILLVAQAVYCFRMEISIEAPGLKPLLQAYCGLLECTVPLPKRVDLIGIESSSLQAEPNRVGVIDLNASIRNSASFAQAYPLLELTLTDSQDAPLARKVFKPLEYLQHDARVDEGIAPNGAANVRLELDTGSLLPNGYRLYLFYP